MPVQKEIIYPIFLECCQHAEDTFWEGIFEDLAYGRPPYGTYLNKGFLCCSYKGKEFSYKIQRKEPKVIYKELYKLLTDKLGILSHREKVKKRLHFHQVEKTIKSSRQEWSDIRKKNIKDLLIERFVISLRQEHSLTIRQAKYLLAVISLALVFKIITAKDIHYKNGIITDINGIRVEEGKIILRKGMTNASLQPNPTALLEKKTFSSNWDKFLKQLQKQEL